MEARDDIHGRLVYAHVHLPPLSNVHLPPLHATLSTCETNIFLLLCYPSLHGLNIHVER
jgi:hypothetical protein